MPSIIGEFHNATNTSSGGWAVTDKIFGYLNSLTTDYTQIKYASLLPGQPGYVRLLPGQPGYEAQQAALLQQKSFPWAAVLLLGGVVIAAIIVVNVIKK
jgi:hypothetical protein